MRVLVALGGNALVPRGAALDARLQEQRIEALAPALERIARRHQLVLVHGNGPQVGLLERESTSDDSLIRPYPLDSLGAETQGLIGYWLQRSLSRLAADTPGVVTVITQTEVETSGRAQPTKPIGATMTEDAARRYAEECGWTVGRDGRSWRRVVPSPDPRRVVESPVISSLVDGGVTVICGGGGGSPVCTRDGRLVGVEAVVDKDAVGALLAIDLDMDVFVLATDVAAVFDHFDSTSPVALADVTVDELSARDFPAGSMGPKVAAACSFVTALGRRASIGPVEAMEELVDGTAGTRVHP